jgi:hypothetical protein
MMTVELTMSNGKDIKEELNYGALKLIKMGEDEEAKAIITPTKEFDVGMGPGKQLETTISGGVAGVLLDARGRPIYLPSDEGERKESLLNWFKILDLYPAERLKELI